MIIATKIAIFLDDVGCNDPEVMMTLAMFPGKLPHYFDVARAVVSFAINLI